MLVEGQTQIVASCYEISTGRKQNPRLSVTDIAVVFFLNNQPDALIIQIYYFIKLYMFRASSLPIVRTALLYIRHW
jgi:hypothetical protein